MSKHERIASYAIDDRDHRLLLSLWANADFATPEPLLHDDRRILVPLPLMRDLVGEQVADDYAPLLALLTDAVDHGCVWALLTVTPTWTPEHRQ